MKRRILLALPAAAAVLTLAGCVTGQPPLFERYGRFALVSTSASGEREAVNGRFSLRRTSAGLRLNLMTPLNGILASIEVTPSGAVLETSQNESPLRAATAEELMLRTTGVAVPVETLERWLTMKDGRATEYGWSVRVLKRRGDGMPGTIRASSTGVSLTLTMDED